MLVVESVRRKALCLHLNSYNGSKENLLNSLKIPYGKSSRCKDICKVDYIIYTIRVPGGAGVVNHPRFQHVVAQVCTQGPRGD